ncbi:MAG: hypothetical protein LUE29_10660 [Lachnospiraceae bacterium]|nr:hypothetical protein [Lachnospiraceae bacterium]
MFIKQNIIVILIMFLCMCFIACESESGDNTGSNDSTVAGEVNESENDNSANTNEVDGNSQQTETESTTEASVESMSASLVENDEQQTTSTLDSIESSTEIYALYAEVVKEYEDIYGKGGYQEYGIAGYGVTGTYLLQLLDFDGDGLEELLVGVYDENNYTQMTDINGCKFPWVEIWAYVDGDITKVYAPDMQSESTGSNNVCGGDTSFYVVCAECDGKIYMLQGDLGDACLLYYYGYADGEFQLVRTIEYYESENYYYIDGTQVTQEQFEADQSAWDYILIYQIVFAAFEEDLQPLSEITAWTKVNLGIAIQTENQQGAEAETTFNSECVFDELGWIESTSTIENALEDFYVTTGIQPYIYFKSYDASLTTDAEKNAYAAQWFNQNIDDENAFLFIYFAEEDTEMGYMTSINGSNINSIMDEEVLGVFWDNINKYWNSSNISTVNLFIMAFARSADTIVSRQ